MIDENPLAQPETLTQPQLLTQPQTFSARAPWTQDLPPDRVEEETIEAYLERLLGSAPQRNSLPRRPGDTPSEDADFAEAQTANLLDDLQQPPPAERRPSADSGRYIVEAPKKNYHCIVSYCFLLNTAVLTRSRGRAWPQDAAVDTRKQAGRQSIALTGASSRSCHVTKRFRILATLK